MEDGMRGILSFVLAAIFLFCFEVSATEISPGPVSGDWFSSGNPFNINGHISVESGTTLNIHEGVDAIFQGDYHLVVYGNLQAIGTESDSILFTAADTLLRWDAVVFNNSNADNILSYCIIQYGSGSAVRLVNSSAAAIDHSTLRWNYSDFSGGAAECWEGSNFTLESCLITENRSWGDGGGFSLYENSFLSMNNCIISDNMIDPNGGGGGGIAFYYSGGNISNCLFSGNQAHNNGGGGLLCSVAPSAVTVSNCDFIGNSATSNGGGVYCREGASAIFLNCKFSENYAGNSGGGVNLSSPGNVILENCRITDNISVYDGGGIPIYSSSNPLIKNCTITNNVSTVGVGGGIVLYNSTPEIVNTIIEGNEGNGGLYFYDLSPVNITYCDIANNLPANLMGSVPAGLGDLVGVNGCGDSCDVYMNIFMDPLFRDPANGDYHLQSMTDPQCGDPDDSPCIDAGDPNIEDVVLDCDWGLGTIISDMGAYGGGDSTMLEIRDFTPTIPEKHFLFQNYPNPFNARTVVNYVLHKTERVRIDVYDLLGRKIETLVNEEKQAGQHQAVWDASGYSSGMYFYRINAGDFTETKKMLLLK